MLDVKLLRSDMESIKAALAKRNKDYHLEEFTEMDKVRRELIGKTEELKQRQNADSKEIPKLKKEGKDTSALMADMKELSDKIKELDAQISEVDEKLNKFLLTIPNTPYKLVPNGKDDTENEELRKWGEPRKFDFDFKPHWDLGEDLGILDPATAGKITGSRFTVYKGAGARLERAIINFMLDLHVDKQGYTEIFPPFMVNRKSMTGTGQLPKFEEDAFKVAGTDYFLIPTAEYLLQICIQI